MNDELKGRIHGAIIKYATVIALFLACVFVLAVLAQPVIEQVGRVISTFNIQFRHVASDRVYGIAMLCVVFIAIVGLARVFRRK